MKLHKVKITAFNVHRDKLQLFNESNGLFLFGIVKDFGRCALLVNALVGKEHNATANLFGKVHFVGNDNHCHAFFGKHTHSGKNLTNHCGIERRRRLVKEHNFRLHHKASCNCHSLLLTARKVCRHCVELVEQTDLF